MNAKAEAVAGLLRQLETTQWQTRDELEALQHHQLLNLATHCEAQSPQFRERLRKAGVTVRELSEPGGLQMLPVLHRRAVQTEKNLYCEDVPESHKPVFETRTSGSTGEPVVVRRTKVNQLDWLATTMREHLWHKRDFTKPVCAIRANITKPVRVADWGAPVNLLFKSAPLLGIPITTSIEQQIELLAEFKPSTLLVYPSILAELTRHRVAHADSFQSIKKILAIGETLSQQTRDEAREAFGADIADMYSSQEFGTIALQCPDAASYHVMAENLIVEILDANGAVCREGETGHVTITDLRNYATPLIRYDIGDYAQVGSLCPCGRGLPTLKRILGRERNLILMPDGTRHWPLVGFDRFRAIAPIAQYQFIQDGRETIEMRLVTERPICADEERDLRALVQKALGHPFAVRFAYFDGKIPTGQNGKFEEFICRVQ